MWHWGAHSHAYTAQMYWGAGAYGATLTNGRWQSLTMPPHLVSQENSFEMHFLNLPNDWAVYLYFLMQSDVSRKGDNGSETHLLVYNSLCIWLMEEMGFKPTSMKLWIFLSLYIASAFQPYSCQMTLPSRLLRVVPVRTLPALGRI